MKWMIVSSVLTLCLAEISNVKLDKPQNASPKTLALLRMQMTYLTALKQYTLNIENNLEQLKEYINKSLKIYNNSETNYDQFLSHPINSYLLTRRSSIDIADQEKLMTKPHQELKSMVEFFQNLGHLPVQEEYVLAVEGLMSLQETYVLDSKSLSKGYIKSHHFKNYPDVKGEPLEAIDCKWLSRQYFEEKLEKNEFRSAEWKDIENILTYDTLESENNNSGNLVPDKPILETKLFSNSLSQEHETNQFHRLCRGEKLIDPSVEKTLSCFLFNGYDAYYLLQPIKLEVASNEPFIAILHDIISDAEMDALQSLAIPMVNNYGTGGVYKPHYDYFQGNDPQTVAMLKGNDGDRMATFMYYLSDVTAGGATVFPRAGVSIWPEKGSGVFWWNLKGNGDALELTKHAGCPVLFGTKWVTNVWIRSNAQMFRKKCQRNPHKSFRKI